LLDILLVLLKNGSVAKILIIDDAFEIRVSMEQLLELEGHEVTLATSAEDGVSKFRAAPADIVITDLIMPTPQTGVEAISQLRIEFPSVRIIAMSGNHEEVAMLAAAKHLGVSAYLKKPFSSEELLAAIEQAL
jgi:DNA-binding NtrC family response regulator